MKAKLLTLFSSLSLIFLFSCSSDSDNDNNAEDQNVAYIKSYKTTTSPTPSDYDAFYEYSNGYLIKGTGYNWFSGTFEYDNSGKLIKRQMADEEYLYQYDSKNRLIKQSKTGSQDNITLSYGSNKITISNTYNYNGGNKYSEISDIYLDDKGRIIRVKKLTPTTTYTSMAEEYLYDSNNNITQITYKENNYNYPDYVVRFQYDDKKNPFYYSFKKLYKSVYYLECRYGIPNYKFTGITPNNMIVYGSATYDHIYNSAGYPVSWLNTYENGGSTPATANYTVEYY